MTATITPAPEITGAAHRPPPRSVPAAVWAMGFGAAVGAVLSLLTYRALCDDAFITLDYARNIAEHGHWGLLADRTTNTQTSPLNALLLSGGIVLTGGPVVAVGLLLIATFGVAGWWAEGLRREVELPRALPYVLLGLLAFSPLLISTVGLETYLGCAVLIGVARYGIAGRAVAVGVLCGMAILVRPDMAVPAGVLAFVLLAARSATGARKLAAATGAAIAVALPWHVFSWFALGGFVPDTTWMKTRFPDAPTMLNAPVGFYDVYYPVIAPLAALPVAAAVAFAVSAGRRWREPHARVALASFGAGWAHYAAMVAIGAFPQAWYFAPLVACSILTSAIMLLRLKPTAGVVTAVILGLACVFTVESSFPWTALPMAVNLGRSEQYQQIGSELDSLTGGQPVAAPGEVGALAFAATVPVVDQFGDRAVGRALLDPRYDRASPIGKRVMRLNWRYRPDPSPPVLRWRLTFASEPAPPGRVMKSWPIDMPARGPDRVLLSED